MSNQPTKEQIKAARYEISAVAARIAADLAVSHYIKTDFDAEIGPHHESLEMVVATISSSLIDCLNLYALQEAIEVRSHQQQLDLELEVDYK